MIFTTIELLLVALLVIFIVPYVIWRGLGRKNWAPLVVVQILTGVMLGPGVFGAAYPETFRYVLNRDVMGALNGLGSWAVMLFVWVAGMELDVHESWKRRRETGVVASLAFMTPFAFSVCVGIVIMGWGNWIGVKGSYWQVLLSIGMACSVTALPILILFLENLGIFRTLFGQRVLRYASLDDILVWSMLALILLDWEQMLRQIGFIVLFVPASILVRKLIVKMDDTDRWYVGFIWQGSCALFADWAGLHYMVGAFLAGVVLDIRWFGEEKVDAFRRHILLAIMPIYFLLTGLRTSWEIGGAVVFVVAGLLLLASISGKLIGVAIAGRILGWTFRESFIIGWLLQTKALILIIFANILLDKQIITSDTFTALLFMAVGSTMLTVPMVLPALRGGGHCHSSYFERKVGVIARCQDGQNNLLAANTKSNDET